MDKGSSIKEIIKEIHANAVAHGWWEDERDYEEIYALIHSEWSEALEEYRAGRPDRWFACKKGHVVDKCTDPDRQLCVEQTEIPCPHLDSKPEGICVELIDGVIRIYDYIGSRIDGTDIELEGDSMARLAGAKATSVPHLVRRLHLLTEIAATARDDGGVWVRTMLGEDEAIAYELRRVREAAECAMGYIESRGYDPMQLLVEKHEYNKGRPYKHGKVC